ncbi:MAG: hypothetical protein ACTSU5_20465 [Promethearchaeota archaeon]
MVIVNEALRKYYVGTWGFDPDAQRIELEGGDAGEYRYEAWFELARDPALHAAGVRVGARVDFRVDTVKNTIVFRRGGSEASVECTHTLVYAGPLDEALTFAADEGLESLPGSGEAKLMEVHPPVQLPPEEHFVALRSYIAALSEVGLGKLMAATGNNGG